MSRPGTRLRPGATVGILGGGQLARMLAMAGAKIGLRCRIFDTGTDAPAFDVASDTVIGRYDDAGALERFAQGCDVITYEFENVPALTARLLAELKPVFPPPLALTIAQDRLTEKRFINSHSIATAAFEAVDDDAALPAALALIGLPAVLKTRQFGYDGKGQVVLRDHTAVIGAFGACGADAARNPAILEALVPFEREVSAIVARGMTGETALYAITENQHRDGILRTSTAPAAIAPAIAERASAIAVTLAHALDYVGVLAVEFFVVGDRLLVNEIAPRVHNSGHWTIEGAASSQFENHMRAVAGWPLGATTLLAPMIMTNLIGDDMDAWAALLAEPGASLHLYGKTAVRPGRKMGHVTRMA